jgi:hypothetical protein
VKSLEEILLPEVEISRNEYDRESNAWSNGFNRAIETIAERLSSLKPVRVYGYDYENGVRQWLDNNAYGTFNQTALLVCVEPVKRGVSKQEIVDVLRKSEQSYDQLDREDLADRIEREGIEG